MQYLGNIVLALIHCGRRFAVERDSVIANDVDAHRWVLLIDPAAASTTGLSGRHTAKPILAVSRRFGHPLQGADDAGKQATATVT